MSDNDDNVIQFPGKPDPIVKALTALTDSIEALFDLIARHIADSDRTDG